MSEAREKVPRGQQKSPFPHICGDPPAGTQPPAEWCAACIWETGYIAAVQDTRHMVADL